MTIDKLVFISFDIINKKRRALISIDAFINDRKKINIDLHQAEKQYARSINEINELFKEIKKAKKNMKPVKARIIWRIGDNIFKLVNAIKNSGFQIDGVYDHLERDLTVKRRLLEKSITFRRYVPRISLIHPSLKWSQCYKATRRVAQKIADGISIK